MYLTVQKIVVLFLFFRMNLVPSNLINECCRETKESCSERAVRNQQAMFFQKSEKTVGAPSIGCSCAYRDESSMAGTVAE